MAEAILVFRDTEQDGQEGIEVEVHFNPEVTEDMRFDEMTLAQRVCLAAHQSVSEKLEELSKKPE
jgi:hypothetical protein